MEFGSILNLDVGDVIEGDNIVCKHRVDVLETYNALPIYASRAFWLAVERPEMPLEVLVKVFRIAENSADIGVRDRLFALIILRTQAHNEYWAYSVTKHIVLHIDERRTLASDLCGDLHECMLRAFIDGQRLYWEENFYQCLYFAHRHVYRAFMLREGWWQNLQAKRGRRIPRVLMSSLDQLIQHVDGQVSQYDVEDEQACLMFLSVERSEVSRFVLLLPERLKAIIFLTFWEGRSEKDIAQFLGISDRTVRNRLRRALFLLREALSEEGDATFSSMKS